MSNRAICYNPIYVPVCIFFLVIQTKFDVQYYLWICIEKLTIKFIICYTVQYIYILVKLIVYCTVYGLYTVLYMYCILYMYTVYVLYIICWLIPELTLRIRVWTKTFVFLILRKCFPPYFCENATNLYKISSRQKSNSAVLFKLQL